MDRLYLTFDATATRERFAGLPCISVGQIVR
jgi:hypothetical protein